MNQRHSLLSVYLIFRHVPTCLYYIGTIQFIVKTPVIVNNIQYLT